MLDLDALAKEFGWEMIDGPTNYRDDIGTPFITLAIGGVKLEGEPFPKFGVDLESEIDSAYRKVLVEWLDGRKFIVWRSRPEIVENEVFRGRLGKRRAFQVWSRLTAYTTSQAYLSTANA